MILCVDPGSKDCGLSLFNDGKLMGAWLARTKGEWYEMARTCYLSTVARVKRLEVKELVLERPQIYVQSRQKGDANDLVTLAMVIGAIAGYFPTAKVTTYKPAQWKGQVPKDVQVKRTIAKLKISEVGAIEKAPKSLMHNVYDAVGIGFHHVGRRGKGKR